MIKLLLSEQQAVVHLVFFQDLSQRQIAAHIGISLGSIKTRLELAINGLFEKSDHLRAELE